MDMVSANPENKLIIRLAETKDWRIIRDVMLKMLEDAPHAFGDTLAQAEAREMNEWQQFTEQLTNTPHGCIFLAEDHRGVYGFVLGDTRLPQLPPATVIAARLWVTPRQRGTGLGRKLMDTMTLWAEEQGMDQMYAGITETNLSVVKFFERLGYHDTGIREQISGDWPRQIIVMARKLQRKLRDEVSR